MEATLQRRDFLWLFEELCCQDTRFSSATATVQGHIHGIAEGSELGGLSVMVGDLRQQEGVDGTIAENPSF